jgi:hypothetical protein
VCGHQFQGNECDGIDALCRSNTVLDDDFALIREDPGAHDEPRFVTLGLSDVGNLLVVVYV